ncbi:MAG: A24 family peptidase [Firmicutes bacterium]|nr:A24 family peptidase [Bacillota bacterium]
MDFPQTFLLIVAFLTGLSFGSFLNVIVYRLPLRKSIATPPSSCPSCSSRLGFVDLIPLFGYLVLHGHCRYCGVKISIRYPLVEMSVGLLFLFTFLKFGFTMTAFYNLTLLYLLTAIALIDLEHRIVPNTLVATGLILGLLMQLPSIFSYWFNVSPVYLTGRSPVDALLGFLAGGAVLLIVFIVSRGGMGAGDVKLIAMIGFYAGLRGTALVLLLAFLFGALVGLTFMALGRLTRKDALPFAPYLSLAAYIQVFWGDLIWNWYINFLI